MSDHERWIRAYLPPACADAILALVDERVGALRAEVEAMIQADRERWLDEHGDEPVPPLARTISAPRETSGASVGDSSTGHDDGGRAAVQTTSPAAYEHAPARGPEEAGTTSGTKGGENDAGGLGAGGAGGNVGVRDGVPGPASMPGASPQAVAPGREVDRERWGVWDTWQSRWCPLPLLTFIAACSRAEDYNAKEAVGSGRYQARGRPLPPSPPSPSTAGAEEGPWVICSLHGHHFDDAQDDYCNGHDGSDGECMRVSVVDGRLLGDDRARHAAEVAALRGECERERDAAQSELAESRKRHEAEVGRLKLVIARGCFSCQSRGDAFELCGFHRAALSPPAAEPPAAGKCGTCGSALEPGLWSGADGLRCPRGCSGFGPACTPAAPTKEQP